MDTISEVLLRGGPVALIIAVGFAIKYAAEGFRAWRKVGNKKQPPVHDAATTNALLLDALRSERGDSARKDQRIDELEDELAELRDTIFTQRRLYEEEISELRHKVQEVTLQLESLQVRLSQDRK